MNIVTTNQIYVGWSIGDSAVSRAIQRHSRDELCLFKNVPELIRPDKKEQLATHVFAMYKDFVYESHYCVIDPRIKVEFRGVHKWVLDDWLEYSNKGNKFYIFPYDGLNLEKLEYWVKNNPGYGKKNIAQLLAHDLLDEFLSLPLSESRDLDPGLICSEYLAECDDSKKILKFGEYNTEEFVMLKPHLIKPVHWQAWAYNHCPDKIIDGRVINGG